RPLHPLAGRSSTVTSPAPTRPIETVAPVTLGSGRATESSSSRNNTKFRRPARPEVSASCIFVPGRGMSVVGGIPARTVALVSVATTSPSRFSVRFIDRSPLGPSFDALPGCQRPHVAYHPGHVGVQEKHCTLQSLLPGPAHPVARSLWKMQPVD